jgi:hypothetical protein
VAAHGTRPFDCRALLREPFIPCSVLVGLMLEAGEIWCEMSMDTTW